MLVEQIRTIAGGEPCVVVAHRQGGTVATAAELAPHLFAHLVYVAACGPVSGLPSAAYSSVPEDQGELVLRLLRADPTGVGAVRINPGDRDGHAAIHETLYGDVDETAATVAISLLSADRPLGIPAEAFTVTARPVWCRAPHLRGLHEGQHDPGSAAASLRTRDRRRVQRTDHGPRTRQLPLAVPVAARPPSRPRSPDCAGVPDT
ncbi:hypothetical protein ACQ4WX_04255 [Streptomyces lasalocidi]